MRLYLSSFRVGNHPEELEQLIGKSKARVGIIMNATDLDAEEEITEKFEGEKERFSGLDFKMERLDLRDYFGQSEKLKDRVRRVDCLWARGGNTYVLRRAMKESGLDSLIIELLRVDELVYAGYSAGVVVLQKSLKGLDIVDDPKAVPVGYPKEVIWDGLGILPYNIAVHYRSDHPESAAVEKEIEYLKKHRIPYKTLRDGEAIIINGDKEEFLK